MYIYADLIGKIASLIVAGLFYCSNISRIESIKIGVIEAFKNINVGSKLMIANIAGMLILGIIRIAIEDNWVLRFLVKYLSLYNLFSNMMMVFRLHMGCVLFPMLKRILII